MSNKGTTARAEPATDEPPIGAQIRWIPSRNEEECSPFERIILTKIFFVFCPSCDPEHVGRRRAAFLAEGQDGRAWCSPPGEVAQVCGNLVPRRLTRVNSRKGRLMICEVPARCIEFFFCGNCLNQKTHWLVDCVCRVVFQQAEQRLQRCSALTETVTTRWCDTVMIASHLDPNAHFIKYICLLFFWFFHGSSFTM